MGGIGHNGGPSMAPGAGFRKVAWTKARTALLPSLPLEVIRLRVKRAERLGLPYKTYATIRAVSGRDIVGFLFSDNALGLRPGRDVPAPVAARLAALEGEAARLGAFHRPHDPEALAQLLALEGADRAPDLLTPWGEARARLRALARAASVPPDGMVVVAATALERDWCATAAFAGVLDREQVFAA